MVERQINKFSFVMLLLAVIVAATISTLNGSSNDSLGALYFMRVLLILLTIFPVCMRLNLEFSKIYYSDAISNDKEMKGAASRTSSALPDLGRVSYLVTDKTGTLTKTQMKVKKLATEFAIFEANDENKDLEGLLGEDCQAHPEGPGNDASHEGGSDRDKGSNVRDLLTACALSNNVTPLFDDPSAAKTLGELDYNTTSIVRNPKYNLAKPSPPQHNFGRGTIQPNSFS
mmetsp:Transcript_31658/g.48422  ORF Transcript_31658/g.48422 Transcript_31658/m.48422 type:complete len:229 (-) Transcript_31658:1868-2554(-)|eukprot:CAMPEP_0170488216 /NCGR_PEP_ID=MMETSP0208-20121228/6825_1 /TAXON_ID=197538 /ORGANISM="Strombidium inclinatum, Strain S3" /LENGTH=228 /DNA_ID=CAMNT_0010762725 /DNA_START=1200 /DNA_END=1886 /DNA_ORIENTATION=-